MINQFTKNKFVQKIIIVLIFLTVFNFIYPSITVFAANDDEVRGGPLLSPILDLLAALAEGGVSIIQKNILGMGDSSIYIDTGEVGWGIGAAIGGIIGLAGGLIAAPFTGGASIIMAAGLGGATIGGVTVAAHDSTLPDSYYLPIYKISPQEIFSDQIGALSINFINPKTYSDGSINTSVVLSPIVAKWYVAIRNVVLVALMVVLLYIGIRIVISSTATEKSKYKEHIKDWLIAIIILVFMHYIMAFALNITEKITEALSGQCGIIVYPINDFDLDSVEDDSARAMLEPAVVDGSLQYGTNLMGYARIQSQLASVDEDGNALVTWERIGYIVIFAVLVVYTVMFLIIYIKRVIYMAFLTIIAPLVALTYPIDKLNDGQSQAFDMWLKEYLYNLLLQPFHLLLYTMLVGTALELVTSNMIYAIVAIGFLIPAEKLLRKFFGFEKASTTGAIMGGAVGGALAMSAINSLGKLRNLGPSKNKEKSGSSDSAENGKPIRTADKGGDDLFIEGFGGDNNPDPNNPQGPRVIAAGNPENGEGENPDGQNLDGQNPAMNMAGIGFMPGGNTAGSADGFNAGSTNANDSGITMRGSNPYISNGRMNNNELDPLKKSRGQKILTGLKVGLGTGAKYTGKGLLGIAKKIPAVYGAATIGAMGAIAGIASDDASNVLKYGAAGAGIGYATGGAATNLVSNAGSKVSEVKNTLSSNYRRSLYGADAQKALNRELDEKFKKDREAIRLYKEHFGKQYKQAMENAIQYRQYGVTDDKMIIKAMQLEGLSNSDATSEERISLAKIASTAKTEKELQEYNERLRENGISDIRIRDINRNIRNMQKS